jgi:hypothetical protein
MTYDRTADHRREGDVEEEVILGAIAGHGCTVSARRRRARRASSAAISARW